MGVSEELVEKQDELDALQLSYDSYVESSRELETALEEELEDTQNEVKILKSTIEIIQSKCNESIEKYQVITKEISNLQVELSEKICEITFLKEQKIYLENENDRLEMAVRAKSATEDYLHRKIEMLEEQVSAKTEADNKSCKEDKSDNEASCIQGSNIEKLEDTKILDLPVEENSKFSTTHLDNDIQVSGDVSAVRNTHTSTNQCNSSKSQLNSVLEEFKSCIAHDEEAGFLDIRIQARYISKSDAQNKSKRGDSFAVEAEVHDPKEKCSNQKESCLPKKMTFKKCGKYISRVGKAFHFK